MSFSTQRNSEDIFIPATKPESSFLPFCIGGEHGKTCEQYSRTDLGYKLQCCCKCHELERLQK
jgi:hypothetical protein